MLALPAEVPAPLPVVFPKSTQVHPLCVPGALPSFGYPGVGELSQAGAAISLLAPFILNIRQTSKNHKIGRSKSFIHNDIAYMECLPTT